MSAKSQIEKCLQHTVMVLMLDEFEIISWVYYMDKLNFFDLCYIVGADPKVCVAEA